MPLNRVLLISCLLLSQQLRANDKADAQTPPDQQAANATQNHVAVDSLIGALVTIPAGSFTMGSSATDEAPARTVSINSFQLMKHEVTFDQYDAFARATGTELPSDSGFGRGNRPVINVSWDEAKAFAQWVSKQSGTQVRLPSEAEWEYASRAGTTTEYWWGSSANCSKAKYGTHGFECPGDKKSVPVGSYAANAWGLHDTAGNVWEWVQDCYHSSYDGAPTDGSAWDSDDCDIRSLRGGSWRGSASYLRSAGRYGNSVASRNNYLGFRLAKDL